MYHNEVTAVKNLGLKMDKEGTLYNFRQKGANVAKINFQ
jgi:hypothetical protein